MSNWSSSNLAAWSRASAIRSRALGRQPRKPAAASRRAALFNPVTGRVRPVGRRLPPIPGCASPLLGGLVMDGCTNAPVLRVTVRRLLVDVRLLLVHRSGRRVPIGRQLVKGGRRLVLVGVTSPVLLATHRCPGLSLKNDRNAAGARGPCMTRQREHAVLTPVTTAPAIR